MTGRIYIADLTADQFDSVLQFHNLTGYENMQTCQDILHRHNWILESALEDQLNLREGRPTVFARTSETSSAPTVILDSIMLQIFNSETSRTGNFLSSVKDYILRTFYNTIVSVVRFTMSLVWSRPRPSIMADTVDDVEIFIKNYEYTYGDKHPAYYRGSYKQALIDAEQELRFLVIYLHRNGQYDCSNFCSSVLQDDNVISFMSENNILFWACEQNTNEGNQVAVELKANNYPFVAVIAMREDGMSLLARMEGPGSPEVFLRNLNLVFDANEDYLDLLVEERVRSMDTPSFRQQPDRGYLESFFPDGYDDELERLIQEREDRLEKERLEKLEKAKMEELQQKKVEMLAKIPQEPSIEEPGALTIVFVMPDGVRIERRFADISPLSDILDFVFCHPDSPDTFEVATNFPKRVLSAEDRDKTLKQAGLQKREVLFINNLD